MCVVERTGMPALVFKALGAASLLHVLIFISVSIMFVAVSLAADDLDRVS